MKLRWFIRSFFSVLLVLCVGAWAKSHVMISVIYFKHGSNLLAIGANDGVWYSSWVKGDEGEDGLHFNTYPYVSEYELHSEPGDHYFHGFLIGNGNIGGSESFLKVGSPFWFVTSVLCVIFVYVWRRTGKAKPLKAFPVELDKIKT